MLANLIEQNSPFFDPQTSKFLFKGGVLIASDIHIREPNDTNANCLISAFEKMQGSKLDSVFFLGDIFDFYFGAQSFFNRKFSSVFSKMGLLTKISTEVLFMEGNHEFGSKNLECDHFHFVKDNYHVYEYAGKKLLLSHGDLLNAPKLYLWFRSLVKSKILHMIAKWIPGSWLDKYALTHANLSRGQDKYRKIPHQKIIADAFHQLDSYQADHFIFGHFHYPFFESKENKHIFCSHSWMKPSFLYYTPGGKVFRLFINHDGTLRSYKALTSD